MNGKDLFESLEHVSSRVLERSERRKGRRIWPARSVAAAAVLVIALVAGGVLWPKGRPIGVSTQALAVAQYPELAAYPNEEEYYNDKGEFDSQGFDQAYDRYLESQNSLNRNVGDLQNLQRFFKESIPLFLKGEAGENTAYSPVNVYLALAMLAELTDGESRQQILDLLGSDSVEDSRQQANGVWQGIYQDDGISSTILASSLWLREGFPYQQDTLDRLAQDYYASTYEGEMGSEEYNQLLRDWINEQTGGLLKNQTENIKLEPIDLLALVTTLYYQSGWEEEFSPEATVPEIFHSPTGDQEVNFLSKQEVLMYYQGENFGVVEKSLVSGDEMWLILPDEGVTPEQLMQEGQVTDLLLPAAAREGWASFTVNLALPKFDISSRMDLREGLIDLGITDVMDPAVSDFTPMTTATKDVRLTQAEHSVRVTVDEGGVTAAAYTMMVASETGAIAYEELDFVLDRPFLFAIVSKTGLPLFAGIVNQP